VTSPAATPLAIRGLSVRYGTVCALAGLDLDLAAGELLALVGPSGCGKSSLLRAIAGLVPATGEVVASDRRLDALPTHRRGVGVVFQDHALFPHLTLAENVAFGLVEAGLAPALRDARVGAWLARIGLADRADDSVDRLSGGERQRVALVRTLAPEPPLVLLDEPFASLDPTLRSRLSREVSGWLRELGSTALFVTHDLDEALALADRVAVMRAGRLVQIAPPEALMRDPIDPWTARFLGHPNVWEGDAAAALPGNPSAALLLGERCRFTPGAGPGVRAICQGSEPLRDGWRLQLTLPDWGVGVVWSARARELAESSPPPTGSEGFLSIPEDAWRRWTSP